MKCCFHINLCKFFLILFFLNFKFPNKSWGVPPARILTDFEGLETTLYSKDSSRAFLRVSYDRAELKRPNFGFLKFGLSFLEVRNLHAYLDLRYVEPVELISKWNDLIEQKSIRYATFQPVLIHLTDIMENYYLLRAEKGKLDAEGKLVLWQNSFVENQNNKQSFQKLTFFCNFAENCLVLEKNKSEKVNFLMK